MDPNNPTPPADGGTPPDDAGSLLNQGAAPPAGDPPAAGPHDWLPEKYRVTNESGEIDEAASTRKLADAYRSLESKLGKGATLTAPEKPEDYKITAPVDKDGNPIEGIDVEEFMGDPMYKGLAAKAHAAGIPNEHMQFFVSEYLSEIRPSLIPEIVRQTKEEASAELSKVWTDKATFDANLANAQRAATEFAKGIAADQPGSFERLDKKFGSDPDFVALLARIGAESDFDEDTPPGSAQPVDGMSREDAARNPALQNTNHPEHNKARRALYAAFGNPYPGDV